MKVNLLILNLLWTFSINAQNKAPQDHKTKDLKRNIEFRYAEEPIKWIEYNSDKEIIDQGDEHHSLYHPYFGNDVAPNGFEETSPSETEDGKTVVFARYHDWQKKIPYIATR